MTFFSTEQAKQNESINDLSDVTKQYFKKWHLIGFFGAEGSIVDTLRRNIIAAERSQWPASIVKGRAEKYRLSPLGYLTQCQKHIEKLISDSRCFKRVYVSALEDVLNGSRRFKSQFETGTSGGNRNTALRSRQESHHFGFPNDTEHKPHLRPTYGYLSNNEHGAVHGTNECTDLASPYGNITVKMRSETKKKATFLARDVAEDGAGVPSPMTMPHFTSFAFTDGDALQIKSTDTHSRYFEAQYHGGMGVDDIESVHIRRSCMSPEEYDRVKKSFSTYASSGGRSIALVEY